MNPDPANIRKSRLSGWQQRAKCWGLDRAQGLLALAPNTAGTFANTAKSFLLRFPGISTLESPLKVPARGLNVRGGYHPGCYSPDFQLISVPVPVRL